MPLLTRSLAHTNCCSRGPHLASPNMPVILDLRAQLSDRAHRARALIEYIQDNGLIGKVSTISSNPAETLGVRHGEVLSLVSDAHTIGTDAFYVAPLSASPFQLSQQTRRKLSWDAERIVAAAALWSHQNARLGSVFFFGVFSLPTPLPTRLRSLKGSVHVSFSFLLFPRCAIHSTNLRSEQSVLSESILTFMDEIGEGFGEDPLRLFFRSKVSLPFWKTAC